MKYLAETILLFSLAIVLWGCPYSSTYTIDLVPQQNIDESLLGNWAYLRNAGQQENTNDSIFINITRKSDWEYRIIVTGAVKEFYNYKIVKNDTISASGFLSTVDEKQFLNTTIGKKIYIAEIKKDGDKLSILPLSENFSVRVAQGCSKLRNIIEYHYRTNSAPMYDNDFALKDLQKVN